MELPARPSGRRTAPAPLAPVGVLALVLCLMGLLAGCSLVGTSPAVQVRQAFVSTVASGPARVALDVRTAVAGQDVGVTGDGVVDVRGQAADLNLQLPTIGPLHTLIVGGTAYAQLPPMFAAFVPGGKQWASVNLDQLSKLQFGTALSALGTTGNPFEQLRYLDGVRDDAREVGREPVEGVDTTRYAAAIDLDRTPAAQDPAVRPAIDRLRALIGSATLPVEVWVDDDGYLRRVRQTVTSGPAGGTPATTSATTVTFREFGVSTQIGPPPPEQVTDLSALLPTG
jgi:hypothetical protein